MTGANFLLGTESEAGPRQCGFCYSTCRVRFHEGAGRCGEALTIIQAVLLVFQSVFLHPLREDKVERGEVWRVEQAGAAG
jgi:hypothetical protein